VRLLGAKKESPSQGGEKKCKDPYESKEKLGRLSWERMRISSLLKRKKNQTALPVVIHPFSWRKSDLLRIEGGDFRRKKRKNVWKKKCLTKAETRKREKGLANS